MAENDNIQIQEQTLAGQLYGLLASANPDLDKIRSILEKEPDLITDKEFLEKIFPDRKTPEEDAGILAPNGLDHVIHNLRQANPDAFEKFTQAEIYGDGKNSYNLRETLEIYSSATEQKLKANKESPQPPFTEESIAQMQSNLSLYAQSLTTLNSLKPQQQEETEELTVGNTEKPNTIKVKEQKKPQTPPEKPQKIANITAQGENTSAEQNEYKEPKWDKIKEKDIIDFMYDDIFLAVVDWGLKTPYMLADKFFAKKGFKNHEKAVLKKADNSTGNDQIDAARQRCLAVLQLPEKKRSEFASHELQHMQYFKALYQDIENNAPLPPQQQNWQVISDTKLQESYTRLYQHNPQLFQERVRHILDNPHEVHKSMEQIYYLASERAAIEWVDAKLKKGKWSFAEKPMENIEKEIEKRTITNFKQIMQERQLAVQMAQDMCEMEKITDPIQIAQRQREYDENYMHNLSDTMAQAKKQIELDVCEPSTYTDKKRIHDSDKAVQAVNAIHENAENLASEIYKQDNPATRMTESLKNFAQSFHQKTEDPEEFVLEQNALSMARVQNRERNETFHQKLESLLNNRSNPLLNKLVAKNKGRS